MEVEGPRVLAAVMFTDLVDSTRIQQRLKRERGVATGRQFSRLHEQLLDDVAEQHRAVARKWEGDGIMAAFPSAADALAASCAIQQRAAAHNDHPLSDADLNVRIGIAVGDVELRDRDADGTPTVQAKRLCDLADGGQILCADAVESLASSSEEYRFEDRGVMELKGYERPCTVVELTWWHQPRLVPAGFPERLVDYSPFGFAGRTPELAAIRSSWAASRDGRTTLTLLTGEPGVGKSRVAAEAAWQAAALGSDVLHGRCDPNHNWPYQPFAEAIRAFLADHRVLSGEPSVDAELARLLPDADREQAGLPEPLPIESSSDLPQQTRAPVALDTFYGSVVTWLRRASDARPVVLVIDDLIWADDGTLDLLGYIMEKAPGLNVQFVATMRDGAADRTDATTDAFARYDRTGATRWLKLGGLSPVEIHDMVAPSVGVGEPADWEGFCERLHELTSGIPFYVREVVSWLEQRGELTDAVHGRWPPIAGEAGDVPQRIVNVAEQRLLAIAPEKREWVRAAALIGHHFEGEVLAAVVGAEPSEVADALRAAVAAGLIKVETGSPFSTYAFDHDLLRESLLLDLSGAAAKRLHRSIGEAIEQAHPNELAAYAPEVAHHLSTTDDPESQRRSIDFFQLAAEQALRRAAPQAATQLLDTAMELADRVSLDPVSHLQLRYRHGIAQKRSGERHARSTLLLAGDEAADLGDRKLAMQAALANSRGTFSLAGVIDHERVAQLRHALDLVQAGEDAERAALLAGLSQELTYSEDWEEPQRMSAEALAIAREVGDDRTLMRAFNARHSVLWRPSRLRERRSIVREWEQVAETSGDPRWQASVTSFAVQNALESGSMDVAAQHLNRLRDLDTALHQPSLTAYYLLWSSVIATLQGRLGEAEDLAKQAFAINIEVGNADGRAWILGQMYPIRWHQGRLAELEPEFADARKAFPSLPVLAAALANIRAESGDEVAARSLLDAMPMDDVYRERLHLDQLVTVACLVRVAHLLGDRELAGSLEPLLTPYADQHILNGSVHFGAVEHYLGLVYATLGAKTAADAAFGRAEVMNEMLEAPALVARTRQSWAAALAEGGADDRARASEKAQAALAVAEEL
ncbi:MAG: AAA family ATPase, partial [Acidimicrobiia bacterium]|nr:AAA family ATPase [Acidimicrobiia bacterium]